MADKTPAPAPEPVPEPAKRRVTLATYDSLSTFRYSGDAVEGELLITVDGVSLPADAAALVLAAARYAGVTLTEKD